MAASRKTYTLTFRGRAVGTVQEGGAVHLTDDSLARQLGTLDVLECVERGGAIVTTARKVGPDDPAWGRALMRAIMTDDRFALVARRRAATGTRAQAPTKRRRTTPPSRRRV